MDIDIDPNGWTMNNYSDEVTLVHPDPPDDGPWAAWLGQPQSRIPGLTYLKSLLGYGQWAITTVTVEQDELAVWKTEFYDTRVEAVTALDQFTTKHPIE